MKKLMLVCDSCGKEVGEGKGGQITLKFADARRGTKQADLCDVCASNIPGYQVARRGRKPKAAAEQ